MQENQAKQFFIDNDKIITKRLIYSQQVCIFLVKLRSKIVLFTQKTQTRITVYFSWNERKNVSVSTIQCRQYFISKKSNEENLKGLLMKIAR